MNWWKVECVLCGTNCDLLRNKIGKTICRECLGKYEDFNEVEDEGKDFEPDCEADQEEEIRNEILRDMDEGH
jgi:hypothetical protein